MGIKLSDDKKSMNVKEMLQAGIKPEEMMKQLQDEIDAARKEIVAENAANETLTEAREGLLDAAIDYLAALDLIEPEDLSDSDYDTFIDFLESYEESLKMASDLSDNFKSFWNCFDTKDKDKNGDNSIIKAFLGSL